MFTCTCTPLNRRLMAHLLKVEEGDVHEHGCVERARTEAAHKAAQIGFTYGALGRDFTYAYKNVNDMLSESAPLVEASDG